MSKLNAEVLNYIANTLQENLQEYDNFIETGTFVGETIQQLQPHFKKLSTIELDLNLYLHFNNTIQNCNYKNVQNHLGDSIVVLPGLLLTADSNSTVFWLDGHYSGQTWAGNTGLGIKECPLLEECSYIDTFCKSKKCILLIDDYSLFERKEIYDWQDISFDKICSTFKNYTIKSTQKINGIGTIPDWGGDIFALAIEK